MSIKKEPREWFERHAERVNIIWGEYKVEPGKK